MVRLFTLIVLCCPAAAFAQQTNYYNTQKYENDRRAEAQRNLDAQNARNRTPNAPGKTYSGAPTQNVGLPVKPEPAKVLSNVEYMKEYERRQSQPNYNLQYREKTNIAGKPADYWEINYSNGGYYYGTMERKKYHGFGILKYEGLGYRQYEGNWVGGKKEGEGYDYFDNNKWYRGTYKNDKYHGKGRYQFGKNDFYEGDWVNGKEEGLGKYVYNGYIHEGIFKDGYQVRGSKLSPDGTWYEGAFEKGFAKGKGVEKLPNGDRYEGNFDFNYYNGEGTKYYANGDVFSGTWKNSTPFGKGTLTKKGGAVQSGVFDGMSMIENSIEGAVTLTDNFGGKYYGTVKNGKKSGHGKWQSGTDERYSGEWKDDTYHGAGTFSNINYSYTGSFKNGKVDGTGSWSHSNGDKYDGQFKDGERHGSGIYRYKTGGVYDGAWKDGKCHGKGTMKYADGGTYTGDWFKGERINGVVTYPDGKSEKLKAERSK